MRRRTALAVLLALWASQATALESPTAFVQRFYDAYRGYKPPGWGKAVPYHRTDFDPGLADAIREDAAAQAKVTGDIVGLDFDPVLGSQDPGPRFEARRDTAIAGGRQVAVFDMTSPARPMVRVDVAPRDGRWVITNFHYRDTAGDLRTILKALARERQRP